MRNLKEKEKKKGKKDKKTKTVDESDGGIMGTIKGKINDGIETVKGWLEPFWGDDGSRSITMKCDHEVNQ